ncbi:g2306 [Coccomyxa viridis]|uniref:G2306 protein n=1 Tax=Coccomyxa viridis TaxID=1274662 RepID=A0ABP1FS26_9CHLO
MSKKNKKSTKRAQHAFDVQRERLEVVKKQLKVQKKQQKATPVKDSPKKKLKGIRIRKGVRIRGIKITDAASKKKARDTLEAEAALRKMDVESNVDWEEAGSEAEEMED